ncbi:MAG: 4-phosphopantetheinyl transferase family protein [Deltaproteobacteria bacterium]|nr:4-phosphopantetheinyl transferase family protein [Deltaproteobacteria bacterium]MBW2359473.1 4-phosphopantetheinyl transferase family protein [Deltaproteobacteria bacterium]
MVGNDVVDLGDAETRNGPSHPRFDARVFAPTERAALAASVTPNRLRWSLWAAKEAAYKFGVKQTPGLVFSPRRFVVTLRPGLVGSVRHPSGVADVALRADGDAIHAVATECGGAALVAGVASTDGVLDASKAVRELARERLAARLGVAPSALRMGRRGRVPTLELRDDPRRFDLSLSHHGRYLAFACDVGGAA